MDLVQGAVVGYWEDFRSRWGLDEAEPPTWVTRDNWLVARVLDRIADNWIRAAKHLGRPEGEHSIPELALAIEDLAEYFGEDLRENTFMQQRVQIGLAVEDAEALHGQSQRAIALLAHLVTVRGERAKAYLTRVADCYINGMETEGVVMCRAVLDAALQEGVDDREVVEAGNAKLTKIDRVDLDDRLKHLKRTGAISPTVFDAADRVRKNGNDAVHVSPGLAELDATLEDLVTFLREWPLGS